MNELNIKEQIEEKRKDSYLELSYWWGHRYAGYAGIIITKNNEIYRYQEYSIIPKELENEKVNFFMEDGSISNEVRNKLEKYIEENINNKQFPPLTILDAGWTVKIYLDNEIVINNYKEIYDDLMAIINDNKQ